MADLRSTGESRKSECGTNRPNAVREELSKCEVNAVEEQRRLQARLDGVLEDRAEAQAETARSLEMLRSLCQDKELEVQEKEELLQSEKKVKESIVDELQKVLEVGTTQGALGDGSRVGWTWSEVQELRQVSQTWAASCMVQPAVRMKLFKEDQQRLNEEALNRWHQQLEGLTLCCGLICLAYLGYHVEPRWPRYWSAYSVGALSSLASGLLGLALEAHRPKETRQYSVGGIQLIAGLVMALVMPILNSVGMPLAQLAAHHFIASSTLSRLVAGSNTARSFASYIALNLWLGAFICQLSWLMVAPTPFVVVLELVMGGLMAVIPASEVKEALLGREAELLDLRRQNQEITENKATQGEAIAALEAKFQEERRAQELSLGQLEQRRNLGSGTCIVRLSDAAHTEGCAMGLRPATPGRRVPHSRGLRRLRRLTLRQSARAPLQLLKQLPEQEQRARLLALLRADLQKDEEIADETWQMPSLTADGRTANLPGFIFQTRVCDLKILQGASETEAMENLTKTCRLVFPLDGSSWMPCTAEPRCLAERLAQEIFEFHAKGFAFDPKRSGAEWWVQIRDSGHSEEAIQFHWDTDEVAVERHGVNVHPHLSTVTYLTECGAPTLILQCRNSLRPNETAQVYGSVAGGALSWPKPWKHLAFDGQLLHGTVPDVTPASAPATRRTFLVNIWLNHRPSNCRRLSKALAKRLGDLPHRIAFSPFQAMPLWSPVSGARSFRTRFGRRRSQLEDDVIKLRQEKREADGHIQNLEAKANELQGEILRLQKTSEASAAGKKAAEAKHEEAEREWLRMETQVQQLKLEARVHVTLAEEQQVVISEQREEMLKLRSQLARQSEVVPKDPREEEKNRQLRECLAMAVDELDARQAQFVLEKQRLTGALEESRRAVLGYLGVSAAHDSARVIGLEQQLASERNRCVEQAVSIQRLEHQLSQQKFYTDQAEGEPTVPAPPLLGAMADHVTVTWNKLLVQKALQIADEGISCMLTVTWLCFDLPLRALFSADEDRVPELQFLSSCDVQHENTMKALHEMGLLKHHKHHFVDILDRASHVSGNASIPTALTLTFPALPAWGPAQEESFWENWILPAKLSSPAASRCVQGCHAVVAAEPLAYFGSTTPKVRALENVTTGEIGEITEDVLWHLAVHKDWGEFVRNPAEVYKELCKALADKEFTTEEAFWLQDSAELEREVRTCKKSTKAGCSLLLGFPCRWELPMLHAFWRPEALECGAGKAVLQDPSQTGAEQRANETQAVLQDPSQTTAEQRANETQAMQDQSQTGAEQRANETQAVLQDPSQTGAEHRANETQAVLQDPSPTGAEQKENETQAVLQDPSQTTAEQMANETQEPPVSAAEQIAGESQDPSPTTAEKMKDASQVNSESNPEETEAPPTREAKRWCIFDRSVWPTLSQKIRADDEAALALNLAQQAKDTKCSQHDLLWQGVQKEASQEIYQGTKFPAARFGIVSKEPPELAVDHRDQAAALAKMFKNSIQVQESIPAKVPLVEEPGLPAKGLVSGAKIHGTVNITGSTKVSKESLAEHVAEHGVEDLTLISYETTYAWHLSSPERFKKPIPFLQKQGGRIWVNLDLPQNLAKIVALRGKASDAQDEEKLQQVIDSHHVLTNFSTYKRPFIRVRHADLDFQRKFYYVADHFESMQHAVLRAVDMAAEVAKHQDEVACMQSLELKAIATTHGLVKGGGIETLRSRVLCHKLSTSGASGGSVEISGAEMPGEKPAAKHKDNTAQKTPALEGEKVVKRRKTSSAASAAHQPVQQQKDAAGDQKESHSKKGRAGKGSTACKFFVPLACV
eukprot:s1056_g9.t2